MSASPVTWVLEAGAFPKSHQAMNDAVLAAGHQVCLWKDDWWLNGRWPQLSGSAVVFHGCLGNAARIREKISWRPGAYCNVAAFHCSAWYPAARKWLLHRQWKMLPASQLVADPSSQLQEIGAGETVFIRPDSPLKPFSGRVLKCDAISLKALDHGYYFDEANLPVIIAPTRKVDREWRYVIVGRQVVAGSAYAADGRSALPDSPSGAPWQYAAQVAENLAPPDAVYVLDVCESEGDLQLIELNPFSGADLYGCNLAEVVAAVSRVAALG